MTIKTFPSSSVDILRIDCVFPAGTSLQPYPLVAHACNSLLCEGTLRRTAIQVAEFLDFRGIALETDCSPYHASLTFYVLRKYADDFLPLLHEMLTQPAFSQEEFRVYCEKRRQQLLEGRQKTAVVARNQFYLSLFGPNHPLGVFAVPDDVDRLSLDDVRQFYRRHYNLASARFYLAGHYDEAFLSRFQSLLCPNTLIPNPPYLIPKHSPLSSNLSPLSSNLSSLSSNYPLNGAVQSTIRIGRLLPFHPCDPDYHRFMVLNTVLGGYFGSRLMSNLREDKGYTYGIYSRTIIFGSDILFTLSADVAAPCTEAALHEVFFELDRLCREPIPDDELDTVRQYMEGDYLRSIDGIFERVERHLSLELNGVGEEFTNLFLSAIRTSTPAQLQSLAQRLFRPDQLLTVTSGPAPQ